MNILRTIIITCLISPIFFIPKYTNASSYITEKIKASSPTVKNKMENIVKKDWTLLVYMASNSSLSNDSVRILKQMLNIGSPNTINIITQIDKQGESDIERIYIQKYKAFLLETNPQINEPEAGTSESLYNFIKWGITNFPSDKIAILLWNNGSGIKDMNLLDKVLTTHRDQIYTINPKSGLTEVNYDFSNNFNLIKKIEKNYTKLFELDTKKTNTNDDAIFAKDRFHIHLTNEDLNNVLEKTKQELLNGKKIDLVFMDACHMAMAEVASQIKNSTKYLVASQEIEPAAGYNYESLLSPFLNGTLTSDAFAKNAVVSFENEYTLKYAQYTQSAINLEQIGKIEQNIKKLTAILMTLIEINPESTIGALKGLRNNSRFTTEFYDADYIDLSHFYRSLIFMVDILKKPTRVFTPTEDYIKNLDALKILAQDAINFMPNIIIKSTNSKYLPNANGISIYFPKRKVHESYYKTSFDKETQWSLFLNAYIQVAKKIDNSQIEMNLEKKAVELEKRTSIKNNKPSNDKKNTHPTVKKIKKTGQHTITKNIQKLQNTKPVCQLAKNTVQKTSTNKNTQPVDKNTTRCSCGVLSANRPSNKNSNTKSKPAVNNKQKQTTNSQPKQVDKQAIKQLPPKKATTANNKNITQATKKSTSKPTPKNTSSENKSSKNKK